MIFIALSFFVTAILYAAVGFGGGSTYNALLVVAEVDYKVLPAIALICNLIVVSGSTYRFYRAGHVNFKRIFPWVVTSVPAAWFGGILQVSEVVFIGLLGFALLFSGVHMIFFNNKGSDQQVHQGERGFFLNYIIPMGVGSFLGVLAGVVGIGGGIFLAPILYFLRWGSAKVIAATCSVFILMNSFSGLVGQAMKLQNIEFLHFVAVYWPLFIAVLVGGQIGSYMGAVKLNPKIIRLITSALILYVSLRLLWRWWGIAV